MPYIISFLIIVVLSFATGTYFGMVSNNSYTGAGIGGIIMIVGTISMLMIEAYNINKETERREKELENEKHD